MAPTSTEPRGFHDLQVSDSARKNRSFSTDSIQREKRPCVEYGLYPSKKSLPPLDQPGPNSDRPRSPSAGYHSYRSTPVCSPISRSPSQYTGPRPSSNQIILNHADTKLPVQPETRPISQEQLANEVKGIYAGLVMVEKKCVAICQQQAHTTKRLSNIQWQALIALHRSLFHEFLLASEHQTPSPALHRSLTTHAMPARMWRHGIHSFLDLIRHRLPFSLEHMLSFVYLAYQMMGLPMEHVPAFRETWIECLGDDARYRMAIEEADMRDRDTWSNVTRRWYDCAADRPATTGRMQHHLAVLARLNVVRQLFYYSKALISGIQSVNAQDSIMLLFSPFLDKYETTSQKYLKAETSWSNVALHQHRLAVSFRPNIFRELSYYYSKAPTSCRSFLNASKSIMLKAYVHSAQFVSKLENYITLSRSSLRFQEIETEAYLNAGLLGYDPICLWNVFSKRDEEGAPAKGSTILTTNPIAREGTYRKLWPNGSITARDFRHAAPRAGRRLWMGVRLAWAQYVDRAMGKRRCQFKSWPRQHQPSERNRWNPSVSSKLALILALFSCPPPAFASNSSKTDAIATTPGSNASWTSFGVDLVQDLIQNPSPWIIPGVGCTIFNGWLYATGSARRTDLLGYGAVTMSTVTLGLLDKDASVSFESKSCSFLESIFLILLYSSSLKKNNMPDRNSSASDYPLDLFLAGFFAGLLCSLGDGEVTFLQILPFCALAVVEVKKYLFLADPVAQGPLLPI